MWQKRVDAVLDTLNNCKRITDRHCTILNIVADIETQTKTYRANKYINIFLKVDQYGWVGTISDLILILKQFSYKVVESCMIRNEETIYSLVLEAYDNGAFRY